MKVFVTGATGLIGAAAVRALVRAGHQVTGLTSRATNASRIARAGAAAVVGDMRDVSSYRAAVHEADAVIHTAAAFPDKIRWSKADVDTFMGGDSEAVDALVSAVGPSCKAFVLSSGAYAYGDTGPQGVDERHGTERHHALMDQKLETENKLLALARSGKVPAIIARPGLVYGDGSMWAKLYLDPMKRGKRSMVPGDGKNMVSFVHGDDSGEAYRVLVERGGPGEIYNIADDEPAPLGDVIRAQATAMGAPAPRPVPGWILRLVAGSYAAPPALAHTVISSNKLKSLGWTLRYPSYREGVVAVARAARSESPTSIAS